jgi:hypothetical protein
MQVIIKVAAIALLSLPTLSFAGEKKPAPARSLAADAAFLTEKSGKIGWASDDLLLTRADGKGKFKGRLTIIFYADKDKASGGLLIGVNGESGIATEGSRFELVEEKGKRSIQIQQNPKAKALTLEYSIDGDSWTLKGTGAVRWASYFSGEAHADFTKATPFRAGNAASRLSADELATVEAIRKLGKGYIVAVDDTRPSGTVTTVNIPNSGPVKEALKLVKKVKNLNTLSLFDRAVIKDAELKELQLKDTAPNLQVLSLFACGITDAGLKELKELKNLRRLQLANNEDITDAGLKELSRLPELRFLDLGGTQVTDAGLKELKDLPNLQELGIGRTKVSEAGVQELKKARPELKVNR